MENPGRPSFSKVRRSAGYTLAELAICLCIIGILMGGGMGGAARFFAARKAEQTAHRIDVVMNVLSAYAQTHYRLPCPADPKASPAQEGRERDGGKCFGAKETEGALPWKELAIPPDMAVDAWGRYIIYRPAPGLTVDTRSAAMKDTDVHNACRGASWYDADGNHINRAKALFCCNAPPRGNDGEVDMVAAAEAAAAIEPASGGSTVAAKTPAFNGSFSIPHYMDGPAAPLLRATVPAVVLISHGPESKSDIVSSLRSDQLFARAGSGSCGYPPASVVQPYSCMPQNFRSDSAGQTVTDAKTGELISVPPLYGVNLALAGSKYQLRGSLTKSSDDSSLDDSVGFYVIGKDGGIGGVQMLIPSTKAWSKGETEHFSVAYDATVIGIGLFVVPDGYNRMGGYKHADLSRLKFVSGDISRRRRAAITDQESPVLLSVNPATDAEIKIIGAGGVSAYHLYSNLNPGRASHTLQSDGICHMEGEKVGRNHDFTCRHPSAITEAGVNPAHPAFAQIGFEDSANINCYEFRDGTCHGLGSQLGKDLITDGEGGYIASIGDNTYDDVAFSIGLTACPQKQ